MKMNELEFLIYITNLIEREDLEDNNFYDIIQERIQELKESAEIGTKENKDENKTL